MTQANQKLLETEIKHHFGYEKRRCFFIIRLLIALIAMCNVSYSKLALMINPLVKKASNFKRIQRFFKQVTISNQTYIQFVWRILNRQVVLDQLILAMDRTNWKFYKLNINILMVSVIYGAAIPLIWRLLPKAGHSNQQERIGLIRALRKMLSFQQWQQIRCLTMDREFGGNRWIRFLKQEGKVDLVLRIKKNILLGKGQKNQSAYKCFECTSYRVFRKRRKVYGQTLYVSGQRLPKKKGKTDYLILISTLAGPKAAVLYRERWGIEVLFGDLKSRGFNFEDTHLTDLKRINKLIFS